MQMNLPHIVGVAALGFAVHTAAQVTFYEGDGFQGRSFTVDRTVPNFDPLGFNDRARSVVVERGRWVACEDAGFQGRCVVLRPGSYDSLSGMGMEHRISSIRPLTGNVRYDMPEPGPVPNNYYSRGPRDDSYARGPQEEVYAGGGQEQVYQVPVTSVRAVVGPPEQRCWVERQQVYENRSSPNVPGAVVGAVVGGVLGHQIGGGRGRDVATAGGAVAGAAVGANVGRDHGGAAYDQDVQRCTNVSSDAQPQYWDVTYNFRGIEHRVQLASPPGPTIAVNGNGEPRG